LKRVDFVAIKRDRNALGGGERGVKCRHRCLQVVTVSFQVLLAVIIYLTVRFRTYKFVTLIGRNGT
jgi:hypothetical protein